MRKLLVSGLTVIVLSLFPNQINAEFEGLPNFREWPVKKEIKDDSGNIIAVIYKDSEKPDAQAVKVFPFKAVYPKDVVYGEIIGYAPISNLNPRLTGLRIFAEIEGKYSKNPTLLDEVYLSGVTQCGACHHSVKKELLVPNTKFKNNYVQSLLKTFEPNNETSPINELSKVGIAELEKFNYVDLKEQEPGTILVLRVSDNSYILRVNRNYLDIWQEKGNGANGYRAPLESIVSWEKSSGSVIKVEEGTLTKGYSIMLPLFSGDNSKPELERILKPVKSVYGAIEEISVYRPRK